MELLPNSDYAFQSQEGKETHTAISDSSGHEARLQ